MSEGIWNWLREETTFTEGIVLIEIHDQYFNRDLKPRKQTSLLYKPCGLNHS